jgi:hypothetical protein
VKYTFDATGVCKVEPRTLSHHLVLTQRNGIIVVKPKVTHAHKFRASFGKCSLPCSQQLIIQCNPNADEFTLRPHILLRTGIVPVHNYELRY